MITIANLPQRVLDQLDLLFKVSKKTTPQFISIRNYTNNDGEVATHVINIGANYGTAKDADTVFLSNFENLSHVKFGELAIYAQEAYQAIRHAILNPSVQAIAQQDTYTTVLPNVRVHNVTGEVYIFGFTVSKTVITPGNYKKGDSRRDLTKAKDLIRKELRHTKFRNYIVAKITSVRMNGETLEIEADYSK